MTNTIDHPNAIKKLRERLGMSQEQLAHEVGVTVSSFNRWENGHSEPSRLAQRSLAEIAQKYGLTYGSIE